MKKATTIIVCVTVALLIFWDLIAVSGGVDPTISNVIKEASQRYAMVPYSGGVLVSHFFWNGNTFVPNQIRYYALGVVSSLVLVFSFVYTVPTSLACLVGILIGRLLWPQAKV